MSWPRKVRSVAKADTALLKGNMRILEAERRGIKPSKEARLRALTQHETGHFAEFLFNELKIAPEIIDASEAPWLAMLEGRLGCGQPEDILVQRKALKQAAEPCAYARISNDGKAASQARDIVGLACSHQRNCARSSVLGDGCKDRVVRRRIKNKVAVNLVGANQQVVPLCQFGDMQQFLARKDAGKWIIRTTEQQDLGRRLRTGLLKSWPIKSPLTMDEGHWHLQQAALRERRCIQERWVYWESTDHGLSRRATDSDGAMDTWDERGEEGDRLGTNFPAVAQAQMFDDGSESTVPLCGITIDTVLSARTECFDNRRRRAKIHVCNPSRNDISPGVLIPLGAIAHRAVGTTIEVKRHGRMVDAWIATLAGQMHFVSMRLDFADPRSVRSTAVRVGRTPGGWAAVTARGALLVLTPTRPSTLGAVRRLGLALVQGKPPAVRRAVACGTPFQRRVWRACRSIPHGRTLSYGDLASRLGCRSAQAVGQALGRNPLCRLIPCHRVVASGGPGGFAWGAKTKARWLRQERP